MHCLHEHGSIFGFLRGVGLSECTNIRKGEQHIIEGSKWVGRPRTNREERWFFFCNVNTVPGAQNATHFIESGKFCSFFATLGSISPNLQDGATRWHYCSDNPHTHPLTHSTCTKLHLIIQIRFSLCAVSPVPPVFFICSILLWVSPPLSFNSVRCPQPSINMWTQFHISCAVSPLILSSMWC